MAKRPVNIRNKVIDAALNCASEVGWRDVSLQMIAADAGVGFSKLYAHYPSKTAIVAEIMHETTSTIIDRSDSSSVREPARDRLLDAILQRLDAMEENKAAIATILRETMLDPLGALSLGPKFLKAMARTLESAGISSAGLAGKIRVNGLAAIYLAALGVWVGDDSPDLAKTMAFLDRRLKQAIQLAAFLPFGVVDHHIDKNSE